MNNIGNTGAAKLFSGLITSKTRVKILMRLFLNPDQKVHLRKLSDEFNVSPSLVREELRQLSKTGFLNNIREGKQINYWANTDHVLFPELQSIVRKAMGMDRILDSIIERLGNLEEAHILGDYAQGKDTGIIDLLLVGNINQKNLTDLVNKTERYIERKIRTLAVTNEEYLRLLPSLEKQPMLLLWGSESTPPTNDNVRI